MRAKPGYPPRGSHPRTPLATAVGILRSLWLAPLDAAFRLLGFRYAWMKALFTYTPPSVLRLTGRLRAERTAWRATTSVPAYADFLASSRVDPAAMAPLGILRRLPETDKASYTTAIHESARRRRFPFPGTTIDESIGSTGRPYDARGPRALGRHRNIASRPLLLRPEHHHAQRTLDGGVGGRYQHEPRMTATAW